MEAMIEGLLIHRLHDPEINPFENPENNYSLNGLSPSQKLPGLTTKCQVEPKRFHWQVVANCGQGSTTEFLV